MRTSQVTCQCGAVYEREIHKLTVRDQDTFECLDCGKTLDSWSGSRIPVYRKISDAPTKRQP